MTELGIKADIFWNLPSAVHYTPNSELYVAISVVNLTDSLKLYMVKLVTFRNETPITEEVITVNGLAWFEVEASERQDIDGPVTFPLTDCVLGAFLIEQESEEVVDSVYARLEG